MKTHAFVFISPLLALALLLACDPAAQTEMPDLAMRPVGQDATVNLYDKVVFNANNHNADATVALPSGLFSKITLRIELSCPAGGCDPYDRLGHIGVLDESANPPKMIEFARFITPFGVGGAWEQEVTDLAPLLTGSKKLRANIDTWSKGWALSARLSYVGGEPAREAVSVTPLPWREIAIGNPNDPIDKFAPAYSASLPAGARAARLRVLVTGHGQGNRDNCAEFCVLTHSVLVDGQPAAMRDVWKDDCDKNPVNNQKGTWQYARAGWCPGQDVYPWVVDLGERAAAFSLGYRILEDTGMPYVNTCSPENCMKSTCAFSQVTCDYDGGLHTSPRYAFSALLIGYR